jgi:hypothetical protein
MKKTSSKLFICYYDRELLISSSIDAYLFKFGDSYQKFHNDVLYFCNWANEPIDIKDGWDIYHSIN